MLTRFAFKRGAIHGPRNNLSIPGYRDAATPVRNIMKVVHGSVDRIDDPGMAILHMVLPPLFTQQVMARAGIPKVLRNPLLGFNVHLDLDVMLGTGNHIPSPVHPLHRKRAPDPRCGFGMMEKVLKRNVVHGYSPDEMAGDYDLDPDRGIDTRGLAWLPRVSSAAIELPADKVGVLLKITVPQIIACIALVGPTFTRKQVQFPRYQFP